MVVGVLIVGALLSGITSGLGNSTNFKSARSLHYAATSATNVAIQSIRYTPLLSTNQTLNASPPGICWGSGTTSELTGIDGVGGMAVWCSTKWTPTSAATRVVTFSTCLDTVGAAACAAKPLLQAVVTYDDYPPGISSPTSVQCFTFCGTSMTVNNWVWLPVVPTVTTISPTAGSISGAQTMTITGTGFVQGSTVNFVEESNGIPTSDNVVLAASSVTVNSSTSITAVSPAVMAGTTYFVTVSTPTGTSAFGTSDIFTYSPIIPTVTSISPNSGGVSGGTSVLIVGTGFVNGSTVAFVPVGGGGNLPVTYMTVNSSTSITAVSPAVTASGNYYVTVTTPTGTSTNTSDTFSYQPLVPLVSRVNPISGPHNAATTLTITGTGFINGLTVTLAQVNTSTGSLVSNGASGTASVQTFSPSSITAMLAAGTLPAGTYRVQVTVPGGYTSSNNVVFTSQ
jgi:hypothetical protein